MSSLLVPILTTVQVIVALALIVLILLQQGKGADMGSAFGGGSAGSLFGSAGAANFFSRMTKWLAVIFLSITLALAYIASRHLTKEETNQKSGDEAGLMQQYKDVPSAPEEEDNSAAPAVQGDDVPTAKDEEEN